MCIAVICCRHYGRAERRRAAHVCSRQRLQVTCTALDDCEVTSTSGRAGAQQQQQCGV